MNNPAKPQVIDHYLQLEILRKLVDTTNPKTFSELKDDGIDNSLFSYHMNKVLAKGWAEKLSDGGYKLTQKGARLMQWTGENMFVELEPRSLINFVIRDGKKILLAKRKGVNKELLNTYLLPGGMVQYGQTQTDTIRDLCKKRFGKFFDTKFITTYECIVQSADGFASHRILFIYNIDAKITQVQEDDRYEYEWVNEQKLADETYFANSPFVPHLIKILAENPVPTFVSATFNL